MYLFQSFVAIPIGLLVILTILYGLNQFLVNVVHLLFPCSVLGMLINLIILCVLDGMASVWSAPKYAKDWRGSVSLSFAWTLDHYLIIIKPPMNFCLKWINVFFIPSFIMLPLSQPISFVECVKIAAVFVIGGLLLMVLDVYMILGLKYILLLIGYETTKEESGKESDIEDNDVEADALSSGDSSEIELQLFDKTRMSVSDDITTIDLEELKKARLRDSVGLGAPSSDPFQESSMSMSPPAQSSNMQSTVSIAMQSSVSGTNASLPASNSSSAAAGPVQENPVDEYANLSRIARRTAMFVSNYIDWFLYLAVFVIALPFYYISSIHVMLPYHLGLTVFTYYVALLIPLRYPKSRKFAHPILILTFIILFVCFIGSLIYHHGAPVGFLEDLKYYKTGKNYLNLFSGIAYYDNGVVVPPNVLAEHFTAHPQWPGCGDFLSSLMDVSIVSLSLPMFTHRRDFIKNFWVLMPPLLVSTVATFFTYPIVCYKIGISAERSIGFIGRLVTLALGTPLIMSLNGSVSLMAVCTILSGICGVLIGDLFFKLLRIPQNDFITRGVTLGINCGAIATAHLLNVDPRAASMSSLSFSVFGTIMVILASIGAVRDLIKGWVGM